jgi:16S rRNA G966 N2-methylase RsmD
MKRQRVSRNSINCLVAVIFALLCANSGKLGAEQDSKQAVTVVVICDDAAAQKAIRESLLKHFRPLQNLEVVDKNGFSSLIVYAEKTVNDRKNPNGYAIAIAQTNCYELKLAYQNLRGINEEKVRAVRTVAERALREDTGVLRHLNVAHLDELSDQKLDDFSKRIVSDFHDRQKARD